MTRAEPSPRELVAAVRELIEAAHGMFTTKPVYGIEGRYPLTNHPHGSEWWKELRRLKAAAAAPALKGLMGENKHMAGAQIVAACEHTVKADGFKIIQTGVPDFYVQSGACAACIDGILMEMRTNADVLVLREVLQELLGRIDRHFGATMYGQSGDWKEQVAARDALSSTTALADKITEEIARRERERAAKIAQDAATTLTCPWCCESLDEHDAQKFPGCLAAAILKEP